MNCFIDLENGRIRRAEPVFEAVIRLIRIVYNNQLSINNSLNCFQSRLSVRRVCEIVVALFSGATALQQRFFFYQRLKFLSVILAPQRSHLEIDRGDYGNERNGSFSAIVQDKSTARNKLITIKQIKQQQQQSSKLQHQSRHRQLISMRNFFVEK